MLLWSARSLGKKDVKCTFAGAVCSRRPQVRPDNGQKKKLSQYYPSRVKGQRADMQRSFHRLNVAEGNIHGAAAAAVKADKWGLVQHRSINYQNPLWLHSLEHLRWLWVSPEVLLRRMT